MSGMNALDRRSETPPSSGTSFAAATDGSSADFETEFEEYPREVASPQVAAAAASAASAATAAANIAKALLKRVEAAEQRLLSASASLRFERAQRHKDCELSVDRRGNSARYAALTGIGPTVRSVAVDMSGYGTGYQESTHGYTGNSQLDPGSRRTIPHLMPSSSTPMKPVIGEWPAAGGADFTAGVAGMGSGAVGGGPLRAPPSPSDTGPAVAVNPHTIMSGRLSPHRNRHISRGLKPPTLPMASPVSHPSPAPPMFTSAGASSALPTAAICVATPPTVVVAASAPEVSASVSVATPPVTSTVTATLTGPVGTQRRDRMPVGLSGGQMQTLNPYSNTSPAPSPSPSSSPSPSPSPGPSPDPDPTPGPTLPRPGYDSETDEWLDSHSERVRPYQAQLQCIESQRQARSS